MSTKLYHNPRCRKSREALTILQDHSDEIEIIEYLKAPPSVEELDGILGKLNLEPRDAMRKKEAVYKDLELAAMNLSRDALIKIMIENPILIERPIVVTSKGARIGRPPESIKDIL